MENNQTENNNKTQRATEREPEDEVMEDTHHPPPAQIRRTRDKPETHTNVYTYTKWELSFAMVKTNTQKI